MINTITYQNKDCFFHFFATQPRHWRGIGEINRNIIPSFILFEVNTKRRAETEGPSGFYNLPKVKTAAGFPSFDYWYVFKVAIGISHITFSCITKTAIRIIRIKNGRCNIGLGEKLVWLII